MVDWTSSYHKLKTAFCTEKLTATADMNQLRKKIQELVAQVAQLKKVVIEQAIQLAQRPQSEGYGTATAQSNSSSVAITEDSGPPSRRQNRILDSDDDSEDENPPKRTKRKHFHPVVLNTTKEFEVTRPIVSINR